MADLNITGTVKVVQAAGPANAGVGAAPYLAGVDLAQGIPIYLDTTASPPAWKPALNAAAATALVQAITVSAALAGQYVNAASGGQITLGTTTGLVAGHQFVLSNNAGKIKDYANLATGEYVTYLFYVLQDGVTCQLNISNQGGVHFP